MGQDGMGSDGGRVGLIMPGREGRFDNAGTYHILSTFLV